jgi:hypothetical protein
MKIMSLSSAAAIAMLAIAGSAWADEPGSIGSYKSEVAKHVSAWTIEMDRYNGQLERVLKDANVIHELKVKTLKARQDAEKAFNELQRAKQELEKSMADLVASLVVATGEVVAHPTDANKVKVAALTAQKIIKEKGFIARSSG